MDSNKQGFPQVLRTWVRGDFQNLFFWGRGLSQYIGGAWGLPRKRKIFY